MIDGLQLQWPGSRDFIAEVVTLGKSLIGDAHPSLEILQARVDASPLCFATATSRGEARCLFGYAIVYPLHESVTNRILSGDVQSGSDLTPADFASDANISSLYVAMVAGQPAHHVAALRLLLWQLAGFLRSSESAEFLFARQASEEGAGLMNRFGLRGLPSSEIQYCMTARFREILGHSPIHGAPSRRNLTNVVHLLRPTGE